MKITNNEIVVELPESRHPELNDTCTVQYAAGYNQSILNVKMINHPLVVDVEALAKEMHSIDRGQFGFGYSWDDEGILKKNIFRERAQHLAANLDKWMVEKK